MMVLSGAPVARSNGDAHVSGHVFSRPDCYTRAALGCQKGQNAPHRHIVGLVEDLPPLSFLNDKAGIDQRRKVMCEGRGRKSQMRADVTDAQPGFTGLYKQAKDRKPRIMPKGGQGSGVGAGDAHDTIIPNIPVLSIFILDPAQVPANPCDRTGFLSLRRALRDMMRLFLLTTLTMAAFAANSVLNRMALAGGGIDAMSFGAVRLISGAAILAGLSLVLRGGVTLRGPGRLVGVASLLVYVYGFSAAYDALDAGMGALILFGIVQITMFAGGLIAGEPMPPRRWIGSILAFGGLSWLLWPGGGPQVSLLHGLLMALAGLGWGIYSLSGRQSGDALRTTAANFILAAPAGVILAFLLAADTDAMHAGTQGLILAAVSGAVTSGLGYALWYRVLPDLPSSVAAVAQLTVPVIAMAGGMIFLAEALTVPFVLASALVLGGVTVSVLPFRRDSGLR